MGGGWFLMMVLMVGDYYRNCLFGRSMAVATQRAIRRRKTPRLKFSRSDMLAVKISKEEFEEKKKDLR